MVKSYDLWNYIENALSNNDGILLDSKGMDEAVILFIKTNRNDAKSMDVEFDEYNIDSKQSDISKYRIKIEYVE